MFKKIKMMVFSYYVIGPCSNCTIHEFVIVFINAGKKMKMIVRFTIMGFRMTCNGFNDITGNSRRGMDRKDFLIF